MTKLTRDDLYTLEDYSAMRDDFRAKIMAHKKNRRLELEIGRASCRERV